MFDAIIVLANLMDIDGKLNDESAARLAEAVRLWKTGPAPFIVPCGWEYRPDSPIKISEAMKAHAVREHGVPPSAVITETLSRDTVGDAVLSKVMLAKPLGWSSVCVVTSAYHAHRTAEVFSFVYGYSVAVYPALSPDGSDLQSQEEASLAAFRRTFDGISAGDTDAILKRMLEKHPFYNGERHPPLQLPFPA